ncbi:calcium-binding protein [Pseudophaeobacter sp. A-200-2]|uniref:calcium-binding protein n=1 Tax=Pseudophaeobacter sp. A-200-2 TaxID=3098145 RepID=UPI0034D4E821
MADVNVSVTFDGTTDVSRLPGQSYVQWDSSWLSYYSLYLSDADDRLFADVSLTGSDWTAKIVRFSGAGANNLVTLSDADGGAGRRIDYLEVGFNSVVTLDSTRVRNIQGWDGERHEITLGDNQDKTIFFVKLNARENILTTGNGFVEAIDTGWFGEGEALGDQISIGSGGAGSVRTHDGDDQIETTTSYVQTIVTGSGNDNITVGSGGAAFVKTGDDNDRVETSEGYVEAILTRDGDDLVKLGTGGVGFVKLGGGNDRVVINTQDPSYGVALQGGSGEDTIDFRGITLTGVRFSLDEAGAFQDIARGDTQIGYVSEVSMENLIGTRRGDHFTGDGGDNRINGGGGQDRLFGGGGRDFLNGGGGRDKLSGGSGRDKLDGRGGNDVLTGGGAADTFVFGKNSGNDRIADFQDGRDLIQLKRQDGDIASLTIADDDGDLLITHNHGTIRLDDMAGQTLTEDDFLF